MRTIIPVLAVCALAVTAPLDVQARMYQWVSSSSSVPQLSGEPPPWYRSERGGPRVQVFENGNLVDDTAIALPAAQREELRAAAFREADERRRADALKRLELAAQRKEQMRAAEQERIARAERQRREQAAASAEPATVDTAEQPARRRRPAASDAPIGEDTVAQLKAIIAEFDRRGGSRASR